MGRFEMGGQMRKLMLFVSSAGRVKAVSLGERCASSHSHTHPILYYITLFYTITFTH